MREAQVFTKLKEVGIDVYPIKAPIDAALPCITYQLIFGGRDKCLAGDVAKTIERYQVDVWTTSYKEAKDIKEAVIAKLDELGAVEVSILDGYEEEPGIYRQMIDFKLI